MDEANVGTSGTEPPALEVHEERRVLRRDLMIGLAALVILVAVPIVIFVPLHSPASEAGDPWLGVPADLPHTEHSAFMTGPYETGQDVTRACLECHEDSGEQMIHSEHFTWMNDPVSVEGRDEPEAIGKANVLNNFCLGVQGNWPKCTSCHAGYGWEDENFDFTDSENVDCLICHDQSGAYAKGLSGNPVEGSDLVAAAQSVGEPTRENCGSCHFEGGGGNGVKHGDLDNSLIYADESNDVHMGGLDMVCTDCHQTEDHQIPGTAISVSLDDRNNIACTDCHDAAPHGDDRLNAHVDAIACETCHIPEVALEDPTKMFWDWSTAGQDIEEDHWTYLKIKGSFVYETNVEPEYFWFDGTADRYLNGDPIDPTQVTELNHPNGDISDPASRISPFKIHEANVPYDTVQNILLQPQVAGEDGYWTKFDWPLALELGGEWTGLGFSGEYGFTSTNMHWPLNHMVQPAGNALQCSACHSDDGRLDWEELGYFGDPMYTGGRDEIGALGSDR